MATPYERAVASAYDLFDRGDLVAADEAVRHALYVSGEGDRVEAFVVAAEVLRRCSWPGAGSEALQFANEAALIAESPRQRGARVRLGPASGESLHNWAAMQKAACLAALGRADEAMMIVVAQRPDPASATSGFGLYLLGVCADLGADYLGARAAYERAALVLPWRGEARRLRAAVEMALAGAEGRLGHQDRSRLRYEAMWDVMDEGDLRRRAMWSVNYSVALRYSGFYEQAEEEAARALAALRRMTGLDHLRASAEVNLSIAELSLKRFPSALRHARGAVEALSSLTSPRRLADALFALANAEMAVRQVEDADGQDEPAAPAGSGGGSGGDTFLERAIDHYRDAIAVSKTIPGTARDRMRYSLNLALARAEASNGAPGELAVVEEALDVMVGQQGLEHDEAEGRAHFAFWLECGGQWDRAEEQYRRALAQLGRQERASRAEARCQEGLAYLLCKRASFEETRRGAGPLREALDLAVAAAISLDHDRFSIKMASQRRMWARVVSVPAFDLAIRLAHVCGEVELASDLVMYSRVSGVPDAAPLDDDVDWAPTDLPLAPLPWLETPSGRIIDFGVGGPLIRL